MNTINNLFQNSNIFFNKCLTNLMKYFYKFDKLKPINPVKKYIEYCKNKNNFIPKPIICTNPRWNPDKKKLIWN